jgi:protocatechuate 4,5-dioxygenase alpha chain
MQNYDSTRAIPGTPIFNSEVARRGYALNKMCFSFNSQANREEFLRDEVAYCRKFGLAQAQIDAVVNRDALTLLREGGGVYFLGKLVSGVLGLDMQDLGALQTGLSKEAFQQKLQEAGK